MCEQLTRWTDAMDKDGRVTWLLKKLRSKMFKPVSECADQVLICHLQHTHQSAEVIKMFPPFWHSDARTCISPSHIHSQNSSVIMALYPVTMTEKLHEVLHKINLSLVADRKRQWCCEIARTWRCAIRDWFRHKRPKVNMNTNNLKEDSIVAVSRCEPW